MALATDRADAGGLSTLSKTYRLCLWPDGAEHRCLAQRPGRFFDQDQSGYAARIGAAAPR
jgi:hypothetical protein